MGGSAGPLGTILGAEFLDEDRRGQLEPYFRAHLLCAGGRRAGILAGNGNGVRGSPRQDPNRDQVAAKWSISEITVGLRTFEGGHYAGNVVAELHSGPSLDGVVSCLALRRFIARPSRTSSSPRPDASSALARRRRTSGSAPHLVLLLHESPALSNVAAAARLDLHPNSIRRWRRRWAAGQFTLEDDPGRGRKPVFSPPRQGHRRLDRL